MSRRWLSFALTQMAAASGLCLSIPSTLPLRADDDGLPPIVSAQSSTAATSVEKNSSNDMSSDTSSDMGEDDEAVAVEENALAAESSEEIAAYMAKHSPALPPAKTAQPIHYSMHSLETEIALLTGEQPAGSQVNVMAIPSVFDNSPGGIAQVSCTSASPCGSCDACDANGCKADACVPWWAHRNGGFGEVLYLGAGNSDLIYAVEQTGPVGAPSPTGPIGISNIDEHLGYRVGFSLAHSNCGSITASYARWDGETVSTLQATGTNVLNSTIIHPSTATTGFASLEASARQLANFQFGDVMLRRVYRQTDYSVINWNAGLRYGNLEQGLVTQQLVNVATGLTTVTSDIDFSGFGIIGGLDGQRHSSHTGLLVYGRVLGSLLAGNWQADYRQENQFGGGVVANRYDDYRVTPVVDTELGAGWQSRGGGLRVTTGYLFSTWFNTVTTRDYIQSVRTGNMLNLDDNLTFSGLTLRTDIRF